MDHIWTNLKEWESIWEDELEREKNGPEHEYKEHNIKVVSEQLKSIRKAIKEIAKWI